MPLWSLSKFKYWPYTLRADGAENQFDSCMSFGKSSSLSCQEHKKACQKWFKSKKTNDVWVRACSGNNIQSNRPPTNHPKSCRLGCLGFSLFQSWVDPRRKRTCEQRCIRRMNRMIFPVHQAENNARYFWRGIAKIASGLFFLKIERKWENFVRTCGRVGMSSKM